MPRRLLCAAAAVTLMLLLAPAALAAGGPVSGRLSRTGMWTTDAEGRVVVVHGFNVIKKVAPFVRTRFTDQDARLLADEGFTTARIGLIWEAVEPQPGHYDDAYIE